MSQMITWIFNARRMVEKEEMCNGRQTAKYRSTVKALKSGVTNGTSANPSELPDR